jgi:hypothetical protein
LQPIAGTPLHYVVNSSLPVIQVSPTSYFTVENGVWFTASALPGPWVVATTVPSVLYTIPPSSPLHYVTYVYVYRATPDTVTVGYTPGYYGTCVSNGVVVYGTGYVYDPWIDVSYYPPPPTYGYGACVAYTPWTGWYFGFGFGWAWGAATVGWGWGAYPYWGPYAWVPHGAYVGPHGGAAVWGPGGWAGTTGNVYHRWGSTTAATRQTGGFNAWTGNAWRTQRGMSYNALTGRVSAGQRGVAENVAASWPDVARWAMSPRGSPPAAPTSARPTEGWAASTAMSTRATTGRCIGAPTAVAGNTTRTAPGTTWTRAVRTRERAGVHSPGAAPTRTPSRA